MSSLRASGPWFVLIVCLLARPASAQPVTLLAADDFVRDWQISKRFTLAVAEAMPAAAYDFKATPEEMTFGEQMMHLTSSLFVAFYRISSVRPVYDALPKNVTKEVVLDWIDKSFDYVIQVLPRLTDKQLSEARFPVNFEGRPGPRHQRPRHDHEHVHPRRAPSRAVRGLSPPERHHPADLHVLGPAHTRAARLFVYPRITRMDTDSSARRPAARRSRAV